MRVVYRISPAGYARDLSGEGPRRHGSRWNPKGIPVIYTSESRSLAAMETLVHVSLSYLPAGLKIVSIGIPITIRPKQIDPSYLPGDWRKNPPPFALADIGAAWATNNKNLLLRVPSAVVMREFNIIMNPLHPDIKSVTIVDIEDFEYDERLLKTGRK